MIALCGLGLAVAGGALVSALLTDGNPAEVLRLRWYPIALCVVVGAFGVGLAATRSRVAAPVLAIAGLFGISGYIVQATAYAAAPYLAERAINEQNLLGGRDHGWGWSSYTVESEGRTILCVRDAWLQSGWNYDVARRSWSRVQGAPRSSSVRLDGFSGVCAICIGGFFGAAAFCFKRKRI